MTVLRLAIRSDSCGPRSVCRVEPEEYLTHFEHGGSGTLRCDPQRRRDVEVIDEPRRGFDYGVLLEPGSAALEAARDAVRPFARTALIVDISASNRTVAP